MPFATCCHRFVSTAFRVFVFSLSILVPGVLPVAAQQYSEQFWLGYVNQSRFREKSGLMVDLHWRTKENYFNQTALNIFRAGYIYYLKDNVSLGGGYAYAVQYSPSQDEHRGWQQVQWTIKRRQHSFVQRFRLEERFRERQLSGESTNYLLTYRLRYYVAYTVPLVRKGSGRLTPALLVFDEFMMAFGKATNDHHFDQNRLFAGVTVPLSTSIDISVGYMNILQTPPELDRNFYSHVIRLYVYHQIDLR